MYEGKEPTQPSSSGSGTQGPPGQGFHPANQVVGLSSSTNPGGSFAKCQKQKGLAQDPSNDGGSACDGGPYSRLAVVAKRGSNSSESDDSAEADKQRNAKQGANGAQGDSDRVSFDDDDDERTDSADEGGTILDSNNAGFSLGTKEGRPFLNGDKAGVPGEKAGGVFAIDHHAAAAPVNMVVGYGAESLALTGMEKTSSASVASSPPMNSPRPLSAGQSTPDTPDMLSPEVSASQVSKVFYDKEGGGDSEEACWADSCGPFCDQHIIMSTTC